MPLQIWPAPVNGDVTEGCSTSDLNLRIKQQESRKGKLEQDEEGDDVMNSKLAKVVVFRTAFALTGRS